ncbi:hypothetical protein PFISCL1PPCAC_24970, partial [Pristionchus fissidentatus]
EVDQPHLVGLGPHGLFVVPVINEDIRPPTNTKTTLFTYSPDSPSLLNLAHSALIKSLNSKWRARVTQESNPSTPLDLVKAVLKMD